jgi:hypothetical protein
MSEMIIFFRRLRGFWRGLANPGEPLQTDTQADTPSATQYHRAAGMIGKTASEHTCLRGYMDFALDLLLCIRSADPIN